MDPVPTPAKKPRVDENGQELPPEEGGDAAEQNGGTEQEEDINCVKPQKTFEK